MELHAIVFGCTKFQDYIDGLPNVHVSCTIETDHISHWSQSSTNHSIKLLSICNERLRPSSSPSNTKKESNSYYSSQIYYPEPLYPINPVIKQHDIMYYKHRLYLSPNSAPSQIRLRKTSRSDN